jgi:myosin heavy subunit
MDDQISVIRNSKNCFVRKLFAKKFEVPQHTGKCAKPVTVVSKFQDSLNLCIAALNSTTRNYVRCIKPNNAKEAFGYNPHIVDKQLRACGVLQTIRISAKN